VIDCLSYYKYGGIRNAENVLRYDINTRSGKVRFL